MWPQHVREYGKALGEPVSSSLVRSWPINGKGYVLGYDDLRTARYETSANSRSDPSHLAQAPIDSAGHSRHSRAASGGWGRTNVEPETIS